MRREGLTFPEALKRLAARAGIEIDERTSREDARRARLREVWSKRSPSTTPS